MRRRKCAVNGGGGRGREKEDESKILAKKL